MLSIIVPVYNAENTIEKCIKSLLNQTLKDIEIILVNDCSNDKTGEIISSYSKKDKRIFVINNEENLGAGRSRNKGLLFAKGDYTGFVDNDDWVDLNYFEEMVNKIKEENSDLCVTLKIENHTNKSSKVHLLSFSNPKETVFVQRTPPWAKVYKREFLSKNKITFTNGRGEDIIPAFMSAYYAKKISCISNSSYHCFIRDNSISHSEIKREDLCELETYKTLLDFIKDKPDKDFLKKMIFKRGLISFDFLYKNSKTEDLKNELKEKYREIFGVSPFPLFLFYPIVYKLEKFKSLMRAKIYKLKRKN